MITHRSSVFGQIIELSLLESCSHLGEQRTAPRITGRSIIACEFETGTSRTPPRADILAIRARSESLEVRRNSPLPTPSWRVDHVISIFEPLQGKCSSPNWWTERRRNISIGLLTSFRRFRFQGQLPVSPPHDDDPPAAAGGFLRISAASDEETSERRRDLSRA